MDTVRTLYRLIRTLLMLYGLWTALLRSRWLAVCIALWSLFRRDRVRPVVPTATIAFVNGSDPAIYRRIGWRKLKPKRLRSIG